MDSVGFLWVSEPRMLNVELNVEQNVSEHRQDEATHSSAMGGMRSHHYLKLIP